jgi:hypothetical protein
MKLLGDSQVTFLSPESQGLQIFSTIGQHAFNFQQYRNQTLKIAGITFYLTIEHCVIK